MHIEIMWGNIMLLEFRCKNHKSIKGEVLFSLLASKDTFNSEYLHDYKDLKILKSSVVYGANGSGKSNFIDAIYFMKLLVSNSINLQPGMGMPYTPHKLNGIGSESFYSVQFVKNGVRFVYGFSIEQMLVKEEYLYYFPNGRQAKIFDRTGMTYEEGSKFKGRFNSCKDVLKPNRLMISCAANFTNITEIEDAFRFFSEDLVIYTNANQENWMQYSLYQFNSNPEIKNLALSFMRDIGVDIQDIKINIEESAFPQSELPEFLSDEYKNKLRMTPLQKITASVVYPGFETDLFTEESTGIQKLFAFLCPFFDIISKGKILICDELETSLHESLLYTLLKTFLSLEGKEQPQIIFTTHDTSLLSLDLFRRDQIWFTELNSLNRSTELYSLAEIKSVRKDENYGKGYISGRYGAIPMLNENLAELLKNI